MSREFTLSELHVKRGAFKRQITEFEKYLSAITDKETTEIILTNITKKLERLETKFKSFDDLQSEIELKAEDPEKEFEERTIIELHVDEVMSVALQTLNSNKTKENTSYSKRHTEFQNIKLPTIELPSFDGNYSKWRSFKDTFSALIDDNQSLSDVQKLCYLRSSLKGDALNSIQALETTEENYKLAFSMIKEKFSNIRRIVYSHVNTLLNLKFNNLKAFINSIEQNICCLNTLHINVNSWDAILVPLFLSKIDKKLEQEWEIHINSLIDKNAIPTIKQLTKFLTERSDIYDHIAIKQINQRAKSHANVLVSTLSNATNCILCKKNHGVYQCKDFLGKNVYDRIKFIKSKSACLNCLKTGHFSNECKASKCKTCNSNHNTLLHINNDVQSKMNVEAKTFTPTSSKDNIVNCVSAFASNHETLLATAEAFLIDNNGKNHNVRILLDPAATSNFITKDVVERLHLPKHNYTFGISAFNQKSSTLDSCTTVHIRSKYLDHSFNLPCIITPCITSNLPRVSFDIAELQTPKEVNLADKTFNESRQVDILINATMSWQLILNQTKSFGKHLKLHNTKLGWIVSGDAPLNTTMSSNSLALTTISLNKELENFWKVDEFREGVSFYTEDEQTCENKFIETTYRDKTGRFVVSIPLKDNINLGSSRMQATKRFFSLERKLTKDKNLREMYQQFIKEYEELGHMTRLSKHSIDDNEYVLPHHCVIREESVTTKLRVVFDGSCKTDSGNSLNDCQYTGPNIQRDLFSILINFRKHTYIATADIKQMYRQIKINKNHRHLQRIVWRNDPKEELCLFELNTVTYGTASAPYLAIRCLKELADQNSKDYPEESRSIKNDFYVDDLLTGADDIETLRTRCSNISNILASAGFMLHKWTSNIPLLLKNQPQSNQTIEINIENLAKTLGIIYAPSTDTFHYTFNKTTDITKLTKREILRATARIFDPLGILTPITIIPKIIIQSTWKLKLEWDEEIPRELQRMWGEFENTLDTVHNISIPRNIFASNYTNFELHGFSDASEKAYGACIYVKTIKLNMKSTCLVTAKSRVAPVKQISLPRLELCAAVLLAELYDRIQKILNVKFKNIYLWTDSTITLAWIKASPSKWKTFVANRVSKIQQVTNINQWHHVRSRDNPADLISRGTKPHILRDSTLWWHGPQWLINDVLNENDVEFNNIEIPEQRATEIALNTTLNFDIFARYSNLNSLINITSYCRRFSNNCKNTIKNVGSLSRQERMDTLSTLIKIAQQQAFQAEIKNLTQGLPLKTCSNILSLNPFLDNKGLLRVGGRLRHSPFRFDQKHQIILPKNHKLTALIASHEHKINLHCSQLHLLNILRQIYWPISGKNLAKQIIHNCITCFKAKPRTFNEIMGDLPKLRVQPAPPFYNSGVDYAGPFLTRDRRGRGTKHKKSYICLFVCFSTKAIHLELVGDMSTESFLACLKRFIARRGIPDSIHSDNGTNFVGAANELKDFYNFVCKNSDQIVTKLTNEGRPIKWSFIPPRSPHFGGIWESNIKLVKCHLTKVIGNKTLTFEEFYTVLTQVEAIVNSRPISPLSSDPQDLLPLTPSHFLIGRPLISIPEDDLTEVPENRLNIYQKLQATVQHFWKRWKRDYVNQLQNRPKWKKSNQPKLVEGTLVLIIEENEPPYSWKMGRIIRLWPGSDNRVRVVSIKTKNAEVKRAINKICVLPIETD